MSDQQEEQEMEAEALTAIFEDFFEIIEGSSQPFVWKVTLWPEATNEDAENHVGVSLQFTLPPQYPDGALPDCEVSILKGLTQDHAGVLLGLAKEEAEANEGVPSIFAICERVREWLVENNQKGHDDVSMHAQMLRRDAEAKKKKEEAAKLSTQFESQKKQDDMTQAEKDDLDLRRKRAEGTPVNEETFCAWRAKFDEEMRLLKEKEASEATENKSKKQKAKSSAAEQEEKAKAGRLTGCQQFSDKAFNLEALEAAAENAQADPEEEEADKEAATDNDNEDNGDGGAIQEDLFNVDDEDLDDLDFDDDDEEEEDVDI